MAELRFIGSLMRTKTAEVTGIFGTTMMILAPEKWLFEAVLGLAGTALAVAMI